MEVKASLEQIRERKVYVQAKDDKQKEILVNELFDNEIPFDSFYNPRDEKTAFRISEKAHHYFAKRGIELEIIEVKNIGNLPLEERNRIKEYHRKHFMRDSKIVLEELCKKYGPIKWK